VRYPDPRMQLGLPFTVARDAPQGESPYFVRHRRARRYLLRVDPDGRVRVTIPRSGSRREAEAFAARHQAWVHTQRARLSTSAIGDADRPRLRREAAASLPTRLLALAAVQGISVAAVSIRDQRTRWGSCSTAGRVCLNWRLVLMPAWVADYVMIHELMHVRRMDHSPRFWALVAAACPEYLKARQWLRAHGPTLR
jgi:predicted metal-dependent hydrolase